MKRLIRMPGPGGVRATIAACAMVAIAALAIAGTAQANGVALGRGDVLAGVGNGIIRHFNATGTQLDELNTGTAAPYETGMCFDSGGLLYTTNFSGMSKFDTGGNLMLSVFGTGFSEHPESCVFDGSNNMYVGQPDGSKNILKFNAAGALLESFTVATGPRGTDWLDLSADGCTLFYTSEGTEIKRYNVCTHTQLAPLVTGLSAPCYAHRILSDGSDLVACAKEVVHVGAGGEIIKRYTFAGSTELFALNLDPDGKTFWTGDIYTGKVWRVNTETGAVVTEFVAPINTGLFGLAVVGEITAPPKITLVPQASESPVGGNHTVTATVTENGVPVKGTTVSFTITGANPHTGSGPTNTNGEETFTWTGHNVGLDSAVATFVDKGGRTDQSNVATQLWTGEVVIEEPEETGGLDPTKITTTLSGGGRSGARIAVPAGTAVTDSAVLKGTNVSEGSGTVTYSVYSDPACTQQAAEGSTVPVTLGKVPSSTPVSLPAGTYYLQAHYSGDESNEPSTSVCGTEVLTVSIVEHPLEAPEFGRCVKVAAGTGRFGGSNCTTTSTKGSYEWMPGVVKRGFTLKSPATGAITLEPASGTKIVCKTAAALEGEYSGARNVANVTLTLTGCERAKAKCESASANEGEIVTNVLAGELGVISKGLTAARNVLGLDLGPAGKATQVASFSCSGGTSVVVRGSVVVKLLANRMLLTQTVAYASLLGKQKPEGFVEKPTDVLEGSLNEGPFVQYGLKARLVQTNEEAVEANSVF